VVLGWPSLTLLLLGKFEGPRFVFRGIVLTIDAALLPRMAMRGMVDLETTKVPLGPLSSSSGYMPSTSVTRKQKVSCLRYVVTDIAHRWGPVAWIIISEVFPLGLRAKGVSIGGSSNWLNNVSDG
jgi:hypothetical protein